MWKWELGVRNDGNALLVNISIENVTEALCICMDLNCLF